jgi:hypothetical protein
MAGILDWPITAGDDEVQVLTFSELPYSGTRVWKAQVRKQPGVSGTPEAECGVVGSDVEGIQTVAIALTEAQTRELGDLRAKCLYWDLQVVDSGVTTTVIRGEVAVTQDVTQ